MTHEKPRKHKLTDAEKRKLKIDRAHKFAADIVHERMVAEHPGDLAGQPETVADIIQSGAADADKHRKLVARMLEIANVRISEDEITETFPHVETILPSEITDRLPAEAAADPITTWYTVLPLINREDLA